MITSSDDYAWFTDTEAYFVCRLIPERLVARMGGRAEDFFWMTLDESMAHLSKRSREHFTQVPRPGACGCMRGTYLRQPKGQVSA